MILQALFAGVWTLAGVWHSCQGDLFWKGLACFAVGELADAVLVLRQIRDR